MGYGSALFFWDAAEIIQHNSTCRWEMLRQLVNSEKQLNLFLPWNLISEIIMLWCWKNKHRMNFFKGMHYTSVLISVVNLRSKKCQSFVLPNHLCGWIPRCKQFASFLKTFSHIFNFPIGEPIMLSVTCVIGRFVSRFNCVRFMQKTKPQKDILLSARVVSPA